ncbi:MAG: hypothetical protein NTW80_14430 [Deltaproteobacteria bacterium]|nr:hypothetical protein [Deltaproteobacteria bacterium]
MKKTLFAISTLFCFLACTVYYVSHDEERAAKSSIDFAQVALIQHDIQKSYALLPDFWKQKFPLEGYAKFISRMHPSSYPISLTAIEYQRVVGPDEVKFINILLYGENGSEKFYYRFVMMGNSKTEYKMAGIYRRAGPYPPSNLSHPLKTKPSTKILTRSS